MVVVVVGVGLYIYRPNTVSKPLRPRPRDDHKEIPPNSSSAYAGLVGLAAFGLLGLP